MSKYLGKWNLIGKTEEILFAMLLELERIGDNKIELSVREFEHINEVLSPKKAITKPTAVCNYCGETHEKPYEYAMCARTFKKKELKKE